MHLWHPDIELTEISPTPDRRPASSGASSRSPASRRRPRSSSRWTTTTSTIAYKWYAGEWGERGQELPRLAARPRGRPRGGRASSSGSRRSTTRRTRSPTSTSTGSALLARGSRSPKETCHGKHARDQRHPADHDRAGLPRRPLQSRTAPPAADHARRRRRPRLRVRRQARPALLPPRSGARSTGTTTSTTAGWPGARS